MPATPPPVNPPAPSPAERSPLGMIVVLAALAMVAYVALRSNRRPDVEAAGTPLPPLEVAGWFNTPAPIRNEDLRGKVVVVDCWFVDCGPCRASMPQLAAFYQRFGEYGVQVIGLTPDQGHNATRAEQFAKSVPGVTWPIGYGANLPLDILGVRAFPTLFVFDKQGRSVWAGHDPAALDDAVLKALAK